MVQYFPIVTGSLTVTGSVLVSGSITTNSTITATTLVVQTITSSISAITGSTNFGSLSSNTHTFTGSVNISSSLTVASGSTTPTLTVAGGLVGIGMNPVYKLDVGDAIRGLDILAGGSTFAYDGTIRARNASNNTNVLLHSNGSSYFLGGNVGIGTSSPSYLLSFGGDTATTIGMNQSTLGTAPSLTLKGADSTTGTNNEGGAVYISSGLGTGNGATSNIIFSTAPSVGSGTTRQSLVERMRIFSTGRVAINNAGSDGVFYVKTLSANSFSASTYNGTNANIRLETGGTAATNVTTGISMGVGGAAEAYIGAVQNASTYADIVFQTYNGSYGERMRLKSDGTLTLGNTSYSPYLQFRTGGGTSYHAKMVTDNTGDEFSMAMGTDVGYAYGPFIHQVGKDRYGTNTAGWIDFAAGNASGNTSYGYLSFQTANSLRMQISYNGAIGTTAGGTNIYNPSDIRLKRNIVPISYGLDAVMALKPSKFNWKEKFAPSEEDKDMLGFIAQEIQEVIPEAIEPFGDNVHVKVDDIEYTVENPLRVNEKFIIPVLVKALQELNTKFEDYKATHP